jgi:hypothetical protein
MSIINYLFSFLKTTAIFVLLNDYLRRTFPEKYRDFLLDASIQTIYIYSKAQLTCDKICYYIKNSEHIKEFLNLVVPFFKKSLKNEIHEMDESGDIRITYFNEINEIHEMDEINDKNLIIIADQESECINRVILQRKLLSLNYVVSNIKFIMIELKIGDNVYKLDLKNDKYNYYIVNNILDKKFFDYFLNAHEICSKNTGYREMTSFLLKLIDHNANLKNIEITDKKFIVIKKDDYSYE